MAFTKVQTKSGTFASNTTPQLLAFTSNVTTGNLVVVGVTTTGNPANTVGLTDTLGNTFLQAGSYITSGGARVSLWYAISVGTGANTVTVTPSNNIQMGILLGEYSGNASSSPLDAASAGGTGTSATSITSGSVAVNFSGDLVVAIYQTTLASQLSCTVASPFTAEETRLGTGARAGCGLADDVNATAAEGATWTSDAAITFEALAVSFKPAGAVSASTLAYAPEISTGPMKGAPFANHLPQESGLLRTAPPTPPQAPTYAPEINGGPPLRGAPFTNHLPIEAAQLNINPPPTPPPPPPPPPPQSYAPEVGQGPAMRGAPWVSRPDLPAEVGNLRTGPATGPAPTPGKGRLQKPFLGRVPDNTDTRLRRHTEIIANLVNSLIAQGHIVQTGPASFTLRGGAFTAARAPGAMDDSSTGVMVGMTWVDTLTQQCYVCVTNTPHGALWKQVTT